MSDLRTKVEEEIIKQSEGEVTRESSNFNELVEAVLQNLDEDDSNIESEVSYVLEDEGVK